MNRVRCTRDSKGRFRKHSFCQEVENERGFTKSCINCEIEVFQTHDQRRIEKILTQFYGKLLLNRATVLFASRIFQLKQKYRFPQEVKFRRYGRLANLAVKT